MSEEEEIVIISMLLAEEENIRKKRKIWVHNICKKRLAFGEFHTLFPDLMEDEAKFFQYFRMSHEKFTALLDILQPEIVRNNTTFREAIGSKERLAVTLR